MKKTLFSLLLVYNMLQLSNNCSAGIPAHLIADNDYAIFAGDENSVGRLVYQNSEGLAQNPITFSVNANESYIYILAMGGDPSWGAGIENLSGTINGKNILALSSIQQSSDVSGYLTGFREDVENNIASGGTYNATLADVQLAFSSLSWSGAMPSNGVYPFAKGSAVIFKIPLSEFGICGDFAYEALTDQNGVKITKYLGSERCVNVPDVINGQPVKRIGSWSFSGNSVIEKVTIPNTVTKIESQVFQSCPSLGEIILSANLTHLGTPETGGAVFYACSSLRSIVLPDSLTYLDGSMFHETQIEEITIPPNVEYVGPWAFNGMHKLKEVKFRGPVPVFGNNAIFYQNDPDLKAKYISGKNGWSNLDNLFSVRLVPYAALLTIPQSSRGSVNISPSQNIENGTAYAIDTQITLTANPGTDFSFSSWGGDAGGTSNPLVLILNSAKTVQANYNLADSDGDGVSNLLEVQAGTGPYDTSDYPTVYTFSDGTISFSNDTELTKDGSRNGKDVASVIIGSRVTSLGRDAFAWCNNLTSIQIPNRITNIGEGALAGTAITRISIPNGVTSIGISAFQACVGLTSIQIPNNVSSIGRYAFLDCSNLKSISFPEGISNFGNYVFQNCSNLHVVVFNGNAPENVISGNWENCPAVIYRPQNTTGWSTEFAGRPVVELTGLYNQSQYDSNRAAGSTAVTSHPASYNLYTASQYADNYAAGQTAGRTEVTSFPASYNLYTTEQIQNMAIGDLVLTRDSDGKFTLEYNIEQSEDLQNWSVYSSNTQIVRLPPNKAFVRIKAKQ